MATGALGERNRGSDGEAPRPALRLLLVLLLVTTVFMACARTPIVRPDEDSARAAPAPPTPPPTLVAPEPAPPPDPSRLPCETVRRIEVRKGERRLLAWCEEGGLRRFAIALSREPVGAKLRRGDERIPEGDYRIAGEARPSRFHRFIPIDYPGIADADRALTSRLISNETHRRIVAAHAAGRLPPQDTRLGGWLGFHGEGRRWRGDLDLDWTEGCVAVTDETIDWLARHAGRGTPVSIRP